MSRIYYLVYATGNGGTEDFPIAFFLKERFAWEFRDLIDDELEIISRFFNPQDIERFKRCWPTLNWEQFDGVYIDYVAIDKCVIPSPPQQLLLLTDGK